MTAESLPPQRKFRYRAAANSRPLIPPPPILFPHLGCHCTPPFLLSIIPSLLPGLVDIYLEHPRCPRVLHVVLRVSEGEALWSTSISITCQDLWVMESKPDCSESVLLKLTSEPLWAIMDEHLSTPLPLPYTYSTSPSASPFLSLTLQLSVSDVSSLFHHPSPLMY